MTAWQRLGVATLIPLIAFAIQTLFWEYITPYVWFMFCPCVFFAAVLAGLPGGLLSTALSTGLVWYFFIPPRFTFAIESPRALIPIVGFALTGVVFSVFSRRVQRQQSRMVSLESDSKLNRVLDSAADAVFITDPQGRYIYANKEATALLGYSHAELLRCYLLDLTPIDERAQAESVLAQLRQTGRSRAELNVRRKDGRLIPVDINATVLPDGNLFGSCRDMSELKESKEALKQSEDRYQIAFQTSADAISITRLNDAIYLDVNPAFLDITGYSRDEIVGHTALERDIWFEPGDRAKLVDGLKRDGRVVNMEARFRKKSGEMLWGSMSATYMELNGAPCLLSITRVITEIKLAQEELSRYHLHLEQLVQERTTDLAAVNAELLATQFAMDRVGIGIHWVDSQTGRLTYVNEFAARMLGYRVEEMLQLSVQNISTRFRDVPFADRSALLQKERHARFETGLLTKTGQTVPAEITLYFQEGTSEAPARFISFVIDITQRKKDEQALLAAKQAAETANIAKSAFLANMSHEIRTPMNAITGMVHLLRRSGVTEQQAQRLDTIEVAGRHLLDIINDVLDMSKIEAGKFVLDEAELDIGRLVGNVVSIIAEKASAKKLDVLTDVCSLPDAVFGDATRLQQALLNYASNAVKFTDAGRIILRTRLVEEAADSVLLRFEVQDTGIGIPAEKSERLFHAFEQADNSTTRKYGGTGLGLAITRKLAELMGGEAGVADAPEVGSIFWFSARLKKGRGLLPALASVSQKTTGIDLQNPGREHRILLVEDEPVNREVTLSMLESIGLGADSAENGAIAVSLVERTPYSLILMDMQMPVMDGLEATRRIRRMANGANVPIVAVTANAFPDDRQRCMDVGMNDFIPKPVNPDSLFSTVHKWLNEQSAIVGDVPETESLQDFC